MPATAKPMASAKKDSIVSGEIAGSMDIRAPPFAQAIAEDAARRYELIKERLMPRLRL